MPRRSDRKDGTILLVGLFSLALCTIAGVGYLGAVILSEAVFRMM